MKIIDIKATKTLDSRGDETLKVQLETNKGAVSACVPQGKSKGGHEAFTLPADKAIEAIDNEIASKIVGKKINSQEKLDELLLEIDGTKNKGRLGANSILAVSLAFARLSSRIKGKKLYQYIGDLLGREPDDFSDMWLLFNFINGGAHAPKGPQIQEYLVLLRFQNGQGIWQAKDIYHKLGEKMKSGAGDEGGYIIDEKDNERPLKIILETIRSMNIKNVRLGLDVAASQLSKEIDILKFIEKYNLLYVEDPYSEEDWKKFKNLKEKIKKDCLVVGDDLTVTNSERIKKAAKEKAIHGVIIKPNQIGTLSETLEAIRVTQKNNLKVIVSHRSGETCDPFIADLAVGCGAWGLKAGAPRGGERIAKYNRLLEII